MPSQYTFNDYSPRWPTEFEREAERLRTVIGETLIAVHHIGSTSVPGLASKPIIDVLPVVRSLQRMDEAAPRLVAAGYKAWGEYGIAGRRFFTKDHERFRTHNIHSFAEGDPEIERHLAFCAYLRCHQRVRDEYAALKREVYARHPADIAAYCDGKDAWIKRFERVALAWYRSHGRSA